MVEGILVFVFGLIVGSFLNVCICRLPKGKSIVTPGSHCLHCKTQIQWYDNIPLLSYIILRGKCRACKAPISSRYFIVELLTALLLVLLFVKFGFQAKFFAYALLTSGLIVATFVDFEIQEIPDEISLGGLIAGIVIAMAFPQVFGTTSRISSFLNSFLGAFVGGAAIYIMGFLGELTFRKEAMGGGDVKLLAMIGSFLGWKLVVFTFFIAPVFGSVVGIVLKIREGRETIPYGPYLSLAALIAIVLGDKILHVLFYGLY